jgi:hypothetical protein
MPFVGTMSLCATGRPASAPAAGFRSNAFAFFSASSGRKVTIALTLGFTRSMRAMKARITSVAETLRAWIMRASFLAPV